MTHIRQIDFLLLDDLFEMGGGYVLNFSNRTFADFFAQELNIDIYDAEYAINGESKAKRLKSLLKASSTPTTIKVLKALWDYREALRQHNETVDQVKNSHGRFLELINRLSGITGDQPTKTIERPAFNTPKVAQLIGDLTSLAKLAPQDRGYKFEAFLKSTFDAFGMKAREPFRLRGEQIDGSFDLNGEIYLLEAKWQNTKTGVDDLHTFHGKLDQKAAWVRGLFVSYSGFTDEGVYAFGRGKKVICMDGLDIYEALNRQLPLNHVIEQKARRAAETGNPFVRVTELFEIKS